MNARVEPIGEPVAGRARRAQRSMELALAALCCALAAQAVLASDHADPIDPLEREREEGALTDLFVFPSGDQLVVILCVRRALSDAESLRLSPYAYSVRMDLTSALSFDSEEELARYGGSVVRPDEIRPSVTFEIGLNDDASVRTRSVAGLAEGTGILLWNGRPEEARHPRHVVLATGIFDDPFIFPQFFGTNVVGMVMHVPFAAFPQGQQDWIVWATSRDGDRQVDHVGRSLRTQNPRFEGLNTLPPNEHVAAIRREHERPGLMRDLLLRIGLESLFGFRSWDFVPDVMIYSRRPGREPGFPNGRRLEDDVAALLAHHGDTLLYELSFSVPDAWPRANRNDRPFLDEFPYLAAAWEAPRVRPAPALSRASTLKLGGLAFALVLALSLENWVFARWYHRRRSRRSSGG